MRITPQFQSAQTLRNLQRVQSQLAKFSNQVSTGVRISRPSDDPGVSAVVRRNRLQDARLETDQNAMRDAGLILENQVSSLVNVREVLTRATQIAIENNDGSRDPQFSEVSAIEVDELLGRVLDLANTRLADGRFVFSGTKTESQSFTIARSDASGSVTQIAYQGSINSTEVVYGRDRKVPTFIPGEDVFQVRDRGQSYFFGNTGAAAGPGTDSATGRGELIVQDNGAAVYPVASGVVAGGSAATLDVLRVGRHSLDITDDGLGNGTISLDGQTAVAFSTAAPPIDLAVPGQNGQVAYMDLTTFSAGSFAIYRGELSTDGGASFTTITADNMAVTNSVSGGITYVDTTGIVQAGTDVIDREGSYDIFEALIGLRDMIRNEGQFDVEQKSLYLTRVIDELNRIRDSFIVPMGIQGAHAENLRDVNIRVEDVRLNLQSDTAELETADLPEAILGLQTSENLLSASLAVAARINTLSLVDFIA